MEVELVEFVHPHDLDELQDVSFWVEISANIYVHPAEAVPGGIFDSGLYHHEIFCDHAE